jgi:hypothetical protein
MIQTIEYNNFTFDHDNANIQEFVGSGFPAIRYAEEVKSQQDGAIATGYRFGSRTFGWKGTVFSTTAALYLAARNELMGALNLQNQPLEGLTMTFNLITGDTRTLRDVRIVDANFDFKGGAPSIVWNDYQVTFRSTFPFFEGAETDSSQQITSVGFGVVVPAPVGAPLSSTSSGGSATDPLVLTNAGNANAWPVFTITGPGAGFTISNSTTLHSCYIDYTLAAGETIEIDTWAHTITFGSSSIRSAFSGDWIYLQAGSNTITITADSSTSSDTQLRTVFSDTYMGI